MRINSNGVLCITLCVSSSFDKFLHSGKHFDLERILLHFRLGTYAFNNVIAIHIDPCGLLAFFKTSMKCQK